jgi:hypothetical protein
LSIAEGVGGKLLLYCFAGCRREDVLLAIGLSALGEQHRQHAA